MIKYGLNFIGSPLQTSLVLLCKHDSLIVKIKINNYLDERYLFIGSFNVGSVPGMRNKESVSSIYI